MNTPLNVLIVEDSADDTTLLVAQLTAAGYALTWQRVETEADYLAQLQTPVDLILSDYSLPQFNGLLAAKLLHERGLDIPFILVTGTIGEEHAVECIKAGATDYVLKDRLERLAPAVRRALREVQERTQRRQAETAANSERDFSEATFNSLPGIFYLYDQSLKFLRWNENFERVTGHSSAEFADLKPVDFFAGTDRDYIARQIKEVFATGSATAEADLIAKDGTRMPYYFTGRRVEIEGTVCLIGTGVDVSERNQLQAQFIAAQKMEVVGQLAGGVAHDFNNILSVIVGYCELLALKLGADAPLHKYTVEILNAAERATALTRQLLVFSRKQTVQAVVLDFNRVVTETEKMLRRLIDDNVELIILPGSDVGSILADAGYVGQVLMNLVVNARDAMPHGGKLTIATHRVTLDENYAHTHADVKPGEYASLVVSDTGTGMTAEVKMRLFEAFFTTKPTGKGTGLGLATCQTIIKQCGGHISVASELGQGTTFTIYFPHVAGSAEPAPTVLTKAPPARGTETLLLVEDEPAVRHLASSVLEAQGYTVLRANNGQDGLTIARDHTGAPIRLVVTDVIMPLMGGKMMADWLQATYPGIKILFTSGYTDDALAQHGVLEPGVAFLPKPYMPATLTCKVREMLDAA